MTETPETLRSGGTVTFTTVSTPIDDLLLAATEHGIVRVGFACEGLDAVRRDVLDRLAARESGDHAAVLDRARIELDEYFDGSRDAFNLPLDWGLTTGFRERVQRRLCGIRYGQTLSYGELARALDSPGAVRAVGSGCARNPLPVIVPCHRVVRSDGSLGGYLGGLDAKRLLLDLEARAPHLLSA